MSIELPEKFEKIVVSATEEWLETRGKTRDQLRSFIEKRVIRDREKSPKVGDNAPDFELEQLDSSGKRTSEKVRLSAHPSASSLGLTPDRLSETGPCASMNSQKTTATK